MVNRELARAGLAAARVRRSFPDDLVQILGEVDQDSVIDALAGKARSRAAIVQTGLLVSEGSLLLRL